METRSEALSKLSTVVVPAVILKPSPVGLWAVISLRRLPHLSISPFSTTPWIASSAPRAREDMTAVVAAASAPSSSISIMARGKTWDSMAPVRSPEGGGGSAVSISPASIVFFTAAKDCGAVDPFERWESSARRSKNFSAAEIEPACGNFSPREPASYIRTTGFNVADREDITSRWPPVAKPSNVPTEIRRFRPNKRLGLPFRPQPEPQSMPRFSGPDA
jgi:hypothetical protein